MNNYPLTTSSYRESLEKEKAEFLKHFTKKHWRNPITKASILLKLRQYWLREQYPFDNKSMRKTRFIFSIAMKSVGLVALMFPLMILVF